MRLDTIDSFDRFYALHGSRKPFHTLHRDLGGRGKRIAVFLGQKSGEIILLALRHPNHGYGIIQEVEELTRGRVTLGAGTLYGAMQTLEKKGWINIVSAEEGSRKKKEYLITPTGREVFAAERSRIEELLGNSRKMEEEI